MQAEDEPGRSPLWRVFLGTLSVVAVVQLAVVVWLFVGSGRLIPYGWQPKGTPDLSGPYAPNDAITRGHLLTTRWIEPGNFEQSGYQGVGPETVAFGPDGLLYTGLCDAELGGHLGDPPACRFDEVSQGWVVRIDPKEPTQSQPYVKTGGRPLGLVFDDTGRLWIADGRRGLLRVESQLSGRDPNDPVAEVDAPLHTVIEVATCSRDDDDPDRLPLYTDSVTIGPDGAVWFTCPSQRWALEDIRNEIFENQPTGRIVRYEPCDDVDPKTCPKQIVADDLFFANGIAVVDDGRALLVNEWTGYRVTRIELDEAGREIGRSTFFDNTPGYPDNLTVAEDGTVWIGLSLRRQAVVDRLRPYPLLVNLLAQLPPSFVKIKRYAWVIGIDPEGRLAHNLQDPSGFFDQATGAYPMGDVLYLGSYTDTGVACIANPSVEHDLDADPCNPWGKPAPASVARVDVASPPPSRSSRPPSPEAGR